MTERVGNMQTRKVLIHKIRKQMLKVLGQISRMNGSANVILQRPIDGRRIEETASNVRSYFEMNHRAGQRKGRKSSNVA